jgi:hypothetical protein
MIPRQSIEPHLGKNDCDLAARILRGLAWVDKSPVQRRTCDHPYTGTLAKVPAEASAVCHVKPPA